MGGGYASLSIEPPWPVPDFLRNPVLATREQLYPGLV